MRLNHISYLTENTLCLLQRPVSECRWGSHWTRYVVGDCADRTYFFCCGSRSNRWATRH